MLLLILASSPVQNKNINCVFRYIRRKKLSPPSTWSYRITNDQMTLQNKFNLNVLTLKIRANLKTGINILHFQRNYSSRFIHMMFADIIGCKRVGMAVAF